MKILITGGSGLLGQYLNKALSENHSILTLFHNHIGNCKDYSSRQIDITNSNQLTETFQSYKPELVIHAAAVSTPALMKKLTNKYVYDINVNATQKIAGLCDKYKSRMFYLSTDLVYAGYRGSMLKEDAKLIPISLYAETKLMGEVKIQQTTDNYVILRTALLYGFGLNHSRCHFHFMYNELNRGSQVKLFTDQFRTPLSLKEAARMINSLVGLDVKKEIINIGGKERVSRFELGERLCENAKLDKSLLIPIMMKDKPEVPAVEDVSMNTDKLKSFGINQLSIEESILDIIRGNYV
jgi:dTDP-4-dehydrorhamnose reductase